ncbi:metal-dependent hydrolase [Paenibacillus xerothermodurans]|uniref:Metal-dependent hydrolase n=1 Tax=Paenibacillus xerothermodurans TaxID=1977292 RepID=A0A2W1NCQ7_PAEXE|nr:metal-dependent hydrolase [Paenibacillus xerothermodurans]PZE21754.1 metal-dependent hydrolase [Paenibacillus xerothermodurans]
MMGRTHLIVSSGMTLSILSLTGQGITLPSAAVAIISSLLPDIDEPNSLLLQKTMPKGLLSKLKLLLVAFGVGFLAYSYYRSFYTPYSYGLGVMMIAVCIVHQRLFRQLLMASIGGLLLYIGFALSPWWLTIGALLMVCAVLPHRGLTHSMYGVLIWGGLLYVASGRLGHSFWASGVISYSLHLLCDVLTKQGIQPLPPLKWKWRVPLMSTGKFSGFLVESICISLTFFLMWTAFVSPAGAEALSLLEGFRERVNAVWARI